ncbi:MAG: VWA domain-containing protein [Deltaproteobacteria bacterium]|nr:VWA domain-containing protein [Deltaproteobacteria bacterium]
MSLLLVSLALAVPGTEIALVLDNSCSMIAESMDETGKRYPANDPERAAVLGTLIVQGLVQGSQDRLTVVAFGEKANLPPQVVSDPAAIRELVPAGGTFFRPALTEARRRLDTSDRDGRLLLFFTDGAPSDDPPPSPEELRELSGIDAHAEYDSFVLGLYGSEDARAVGAPYLQTMGRTTDDVVFMKDPAQVVPAFTRGYARALGSRPEVGTMRAGETRSFAVPKYVVEMLAVTASSRPGDAYAAEMGGPSGSVAARAKGDNGCSTLRIAGAPRLCSPPRRHYAVFRADNDPGVASTWTLSIPSAPGEVEFGVIYRYDLEPALDVASTVKVGDTVRVEASLLSRGAPFDDPQFFAADGFAVNLEVDGHRQAMTHAGGGKFVAEWSPDTPHDKDHPAALTVNFHNTWLDLSARRAVVVDGFLDLSLRLAPSPLDLGSWRGGRGSTQRCGVLDLAGSQNAERVRLACTVDGVPPGYALSCEPVPGSEARLGASLGQPMAWQVCLSTPSCCDAAASPAGGETRVTLQGAHAHYAPGAVVVPLRFEVEATGFLRCFWPLLAVLGAVVTTLWVIIGVVRPYSFSTMAAVRIAEKESNLGRASALALRERPGGKRGFYRNAKVCISAGGDFGRTPRLAVVVVEAAPGGTTVFRRADGLEKKNRSSGKWERVDASELALGYVPGMVYRAGSLHLKFD